MVKRDPIKDLDLRRKPKGQNSVYVSDMAAYTGQTSPSPWQQSIWDGGKFPGGFGDTQLYEMDYWTLRARSEQLFRENLYAMGLIRRLVTNEIGPGLFPEATPNETVLGLSEDFLNDLSDLIETRFSLWGILAGVCDFTRRMTWGGLNRAARIEAHISGDCLVVLRENPKTKAPSVQLIGGNAVQNPSFGNLPPIKAGHEVEHGVEIDKDGREVAYYVLQKDNTTKRISAYGPRSRRRRAWLVYGSDLRHGQRRGVPMLGIVLQSLKEIDRYRDSTQRKAVINSILAMFIKKSEDKPGSLPMQGGAVKRGAVESVDSNGATRTFNLAGQIPGVIAEELQHGEEPVLKGGEGTDINFSTFEDAILRAVAWANEVPPEILMLAFSNNYSASQAAINEFKIYLNKIWSVWGESFCFPIYQDWLISEALLQKIKVDGFLEAWRDPARYDLFAAWVSCEWYGSIKPSTDMLKQGKGSQLLVQEGWSTNAREARVTTGTKFSQNIKRLKRENQLKAEAARPLLELEQEFKPERAQSALSEIEDKVLELVDFMGDRAS